MTYRIKGMCESCGTNYMGEVKDFSAVKCPVCKKETYNNDEESVVEELNKTEGEEITYTEYIFE
jgi:uncharacterized Zn finger protein (UPF0148 family)